MLYQEKFSKYYQKFFYPPTSVLVIYFASMFGVIVTLVLMAVSIGMLFLNLVDKLEYVHYINSLWWIGVPSLVIFWSTWIVIRIKWPRFLKKSINTIDIKRSEINVSEYKTEEMNR